MKKILGFFKNSHEDVFKILLAITTVVLIVLMLPKDISFKYGYELGKPWLFDNLSAPFDFPINKTPEELEGERTKILENVKSYFKFNDEVQEKKTNDFIKDAATKWHLLKPSQNAYLDSIERSKQLDIGAAVLDAVYDKGIILLPEEFQKKPPTFVIMVNHDKIAEAKELHQLYTPQSAYQYIENVLENDRKADKTFLLPLLENSLTPNVFYDDALTRMIYRDQLDNVSTANGIMQKGEPIITTGDLVDKNKFRLLESLRIEYESQIGTKSSAINITSGQLIVVSLAIAMLILFLAIFRRDVYVDNRKLILPLLLILIVVGTYNLSMRSSILNPYLIPFCIVPMIIKAFFDTRMAMFVHLTVLLIIGFIAPNGFEFVFMQIIAGMVTTFSIISLRKRSQLFITSGAILLAYILAYIGVSKLHSEHYSSINWINLGWFGANALLTLLAYPMIFIFEKLFGITSEVSLLELVDTNSPLMRQLALKAPGTFQHSLQVSNLAEAAITKINGNTLLVRAGALYYDFGKINNPRYFMENPI